MMVDLDTLRGLAVAVGIGLLVGVERERRRAEDGHGVAGVRTFALIALAGALAERVGGIGIALAGGHDQVRPVLVFSHHAPEPLR